MNDRLRFNKTDVLWCGILFLVILFSFFNFSYRFYPLLNADMAINILMTPGYHLPGDLYAWGQDRGGSLIPLLAHIVYNLLHFSPVSSVSVVHYLILIAGFIATAMIFRSWISRFFLALLWFFPPWHFTDFVLFPFGTQFSLFMVAVYLLGLAERSVKPVVKHMWIAASSILMILGIWVSELGILMIILFIILKIYTGLRNGKSIFRKENTPAIVHLLFWTVAGIIFILYAKSTAVKVDAYSSQPLNTPVEIIGSLKTVAQSLYQVFTFSSENFIESIYAWLLIAGIPVVFYFSLPGNKGWIRPAANSWPVFFLLNGIITFLVIILSHWAFLNGTGRRYFVLVYLSVAIVILLLAELAKNDKRMIVNLAIAVVILTGAVSSVYKFYYPKHVPARIRILSEFQSLGNIGLISEYWNSYLSATPDPVNIKATPHDKDYVRNYKLAEEVFAQPRIYIIKDCWLNSFPDTIRQFGRTLVKKGDKLHLGDCWINQYEVVNK